MAKHFSILQQSAADLPHSAKCQVLHELDPTLLRTQESDGWLPVHGACRDGRLETAKYLLEIYPDSINIATNKGQCPLHLLVNRGTEDESEVVELLGFVLKHDGGVASTPDRRGYLLLHYACFRGRLALVKPLFDAHPDGIYLQDNLGDTPLDTAIAYNQADVVQYLETQLEFRSQALELQEVDNNGQLLSIHRALQGKVASLGAIKLMVAAHPASVTVADTQGCNPIHLACQFGRLSIVEYLLGLDEDSTNTLQTRDAGGNLPLHHACLAGKPDIVNYILKTTDHGVSVRNNVGKLPIQLFLFHAVCVRDMQYMDAVYSLLRANPIDSLAILSPGFFVDKE